MAKAEKKGSSTLPKPLADRIGRLFNLLFNRLTMYYLDHPSTYETIAHLTAALREGLRHASRLAVILDREQILVEDEPLDPNVNPQRLVAHMKKVGVQSVSFERGVLEREVKGFASVFGDPQAYPDAEAMKEGIAQRGAHRVLINHVFFKKMTVDQEVVRRGEGSPGEGIGLTRVLIDTSSGEEGWEDLDGPPRVDRSTLGQILTYLDLSSLISDPAAASRRLLDAEVRPPEGIAGTVGEGAVLQGIRHLRSQLHEIGTASEPGGSAEDLLQAVFQLRESLHQGIERRRRDGAPVVGEELIREEMDDLTDQVMIQLIREEYRKGQITLKRLAQIIRRMMPDMKDLKRMLPKLKEALLAEGMPLADYLQLIRELQRELQSEELAQILETGAEEIGLTVEDIIDEIRRDPKIAAELIALAAELRATGSQGDQGVLSQILVDYVERIGGSLAVDEAQTAGPEGIQHLQETLAQIQEELMGGLRKRLADSAVADRVEQSLLERRAENVESLRTDLIFRQFLQDTQTRVDVQGLLRAVEAAYPEPNQQGEILGLVLQAMEARGLDPGPLQAALTQRVEVRPVESDPQKVPKGTLTRIMILFFISEEVKRARRFGHIFSVLLLSIKQATATRPVPIGLIRPHEIRNALMVHLTKLVRDVDLVGGLEENKVLVLLPLTDADGAERTRQRIVKDVDGGTLIVRGIPMSINLAVVEETFAKEEMPHLKALLVRLERRLSDALKS